MRKKGSTIEKEIIEDQLYRLSRNLNNYKMELEKEYITKIRPLEVLQEHLDSIIKRQGRKK